MFTVLSDVVDVEEMHKSVTEDVNGASKVMSLFEKYGGVPNFMQMYTLFAQVYDGFEAYDAICAAKVTDEESLRPKQTITIERAYMSTYGEHKNDSFFDPDTYTLSAGDTVSTDVE